MAANFCRPQRIVHLQLRRNHHHRRRERRYWHRTGAITVGGTVNTGGGGVHRHGYGLHEQCRHFRRRLRLRPRTRFRSTPAPAPAPSASTARSTGRPVRAAASRLKAADSITVTASGSIDAAGGSSVPIALYTTGSGSAVTLTGTVDTGSTFISDGGNFTVSYAGYSPRRS